MSEPRLEIDGTPQVERTVWFCQGAARSEVARLPPVEEEGMPGVPTSTEWDEVTLYRVDDAFFVERRAWVDIHVIGDSSSGWGWQRSSDGLRWESCPAPDDPGPPLSNVSSLGS